MRERSTLALSIALAHVSEQRDEREKLTQQRALLRVKLDILQNGGSGFSRPMPPQHYKAKRRRKAPSEDP